MTSIEMAPVQSTNISAIGYDSNTYTLQIQFKNGDVYQYSNVPQSVYAGLMSGDIGRYFAEIIKPQRYTMPFVKLGRMPPPGPGPVLPDSTVGDM